MVSPALQTYVDGAVGLSGVVTVPDRTLRRHVVPEVDQADGGDRLALCDRHWTPLIALIASEAVSAMASGAYRRPS
jgi:hypothetical protein